MQAIQVFSDEWWFQLTVVMFYLCAFTFSLCAMEIAVCIWAELRGEKTDLPTQESVHRLFMRVRRFFIRRRRQRILAQRFTNQLTNSYDQSTSHIGTRIRSGNLARTDQAR